MSLTALPAKVHHQSGEAIDAMNRMAEWVRAVLGSGVGVSFQPPSTVLADQRQVDLYALALTSHATPRDVRVPQVRFDLRVLVTTWAPDPLTAHQDLCDLAFAATDAPMFQFDRGAPADLPWVALGIGPRPALLLCVPLQRQLIIAPVRRVREQPVINAIPILDHGIQTDHG